VDGGLGVGRILEGEIREHLLRLDALPSGALDVSLYEDAGGAWRLKLYRSGEHLSLSQVLPLLEHLGVEVLDERPYEVEAVDAPAGRMWIYDFALGTIEAAGAAPGTLKTLFEEAFSAMWRGEVEADAFNHLILRGALTWRQVGVLRAYARYLRQTGIPFSQDYIADVLVSHVHLAGVLVRLFESRFHPDERGPGQRQERSAAIAEEGIRALATGISASVRTPDDLEARTEAMYGAYLAGAAPPRAGARALAFSERAAVKYNGLWPVPSGTGPVVHSVRQLPVGGDSHLFGSAGARPALQPCPLHGRLRSRGR
jgi:hypothetical protein